MTPRERQLIGWALYSRADLLKIFMTSESGYNARSLVVSEIAELTTLAHRIESGQLEMSLTDPDQKTMRNAIRLAIAVSATPDEKEYRKLAEHLGMELEP